MRFQDAARDARTVVYAGVQADPLVARIAVLLAEATPGERWLARAVMNGERVEAEAWRRIFPSLFGEDATAEVRDRAEGLLAACLAVADRGDQARSSYRGAVVEELTARLLAGLGGPRPAATGPGPAAPAPIRRERRIAFDGVAAEIHPYDVTVEAAARPEAYDCKWGARGINADVLHQLDDARGHAADEDVELRVALVVFDARRSCRIRLDRSTAPHDRTGLFALEDLDELARTRP